MPSDKNQNPYELRLNLLHLAKEILEVNCHMARDDKNLAAEYPDNPFVEGGAPVESSRKTYYTLEEVIATATQLNQFVSNKG